MLAMLLMLATFTTTANAAKKVNTNNVRYTELRNYFHNNDAPMPSSPLITTQKEFEAQFGMAAYMGKGGQPTPVNFKKQAVLAIVLPETNKSTSIDSISVKQTGKDELTLAYTVHEGAERGYTTQPIYLMAVDKKYKSYSVKVVPTVHKEVTTSSNTYESFSLNDTRHSMHLDVDYPLSGNENLVKGIREYLSERLGKLAAMFNLSLSKPQIVAYNATSAKDLLGYYATVIADSMDNMDKAGGTYGNPNHCSLTASVKRVYENDRFVSYEANGYAYMGGAHGLGFCDGATFDKTTGKQVTLVKESPKLLELVTKRLHREWEDVPQFEHEPVPMPQAAPYVVANGKIKFVYQPYEVGPYAIGMPDCEFYPYEIEDFLTAEGKMMER